MHPEPDPCGCPPEWWDNRTGAVVAVAVSGGLLAAVLAFGWGGWTGQTLGALGAALVALGLSLSNLRDVVRRQRDTLPPTVIPLTRRRPR